MIKTSVPGRKREPYTGVPNSPTPKRVWQVKRKDKSMYIIFFDNRGLYTNTSF
jgi:hypothetical protein